MKAAAEATYLDILNDIPDPTLTATSDLSVSLGRGLAGSSARRCRPPGEEQGRLQAAPPRGRSAHFPRRQLQCVCKSARIVAFVLAVVVLFTLALYGLISNIADGLAAVDESCGYHSGGDVSTCELDRNNTAALALSIWLAVGASGMTSLIAVFHVMIARVSFLMSFACSLL